MNNEFHFTDAEKEQIQHATHHAMSDTLRQLYPLFEKVCGERIAALKDEVERLKDLLFCNCRVPYFGAQIVGSPLRCERCLKEIGFSGPTLRERLKQLEAENASLSAHGRRMDALLTGKDREETAEKIFEACRGSMNTRSVYILADELIAARKKGA